MARLRFRITWTIGLLFTALNLIGIGAVLLLGVHGAGRTAEALLLERRKDAIETAGEGLALVLRPVAAQADAIAAAVRDGRLDSATRAAMTPFLDGALAATPQVAAIEIVDTTLRVEVFARDDRFDATVTGDRPRSAWIEPALSWARGADAPRWTHGWSQVLGGPVIMRHTPLRRGEAFAGVLVSVVTIPELGRRLRLVAREVGDPVFALFERGFVVGHSDPRGGFAPSEREPFPTLAQAGDPVLARIWDPAAVPLEAEMVVAGVAGHRVASDAGEAVFLYRPIDVDGGRFYFVGTYHVGSRTAEETARLRRMAAAGLAVLVASILLTILIGRRISRPVRTLAGAAAVVEREDYAAFQPFAPNRIREIDDAGQAFNHMVEGLKERQRIRDMFGKYVPQEVVEQLLAHPGAFALGGERREVSLLFTDITGFTALAETMPPSDVLHLLNDYFEELCRCVHSHQGIVADLIGDAVFAIFGAPIARADHARRAVSCVREMDRVSTAFAAARAAEGTPLGTTRIGLHVGFATVGNFGSADRLKYTAAGDVVNTAARLESANKFFGTRLLASRAIVDAAEDANWRPVAALVVKGRRAALEVVEVLPRQIAAEGWMQDYRRAYALLEAGSVEALAALRALAGARPHDPVIRFHLERAERGRVSAAVELTEK